MKVVKVTTKGQITIPIEIRTELGITEQTYLQVTTEGGDVRLRRIADIRPLSGDDPIWELVGAETSGEHDAAQNHDRYLAEGEIERWRES